MAKQARADSSQSGSTAPAGYPDDLCQQVERYLATLDFADVSGAEGLVKAMRYSLLAGGKRIRPVLCLATVRSLGADPAGALPTAAALEMIHTYSLIHDDLPSLDDDALRRGKPTCHIEFGEDVAILAGDALFAEAFALILKKQRADPTAKTGVLSELTSAAGLDGMVGGQYLDVVGPVATDRETLCRMHELKTGRLIAASVGCALSLVDVSEERANLYREFGLKLGVLFQIVDDILDVVGSEHEMGKARGSDERLGKGTYVSVFGLESARTLAAQAHEAALAVLEAVEDPARDLRQITDFIFTRTR